ncbi:MAG: hypothetical protein AB4062_21315 [Crocosphaera sp.]
MNNNKILNNRENLRQDYPAAHSMDTTWFAVDKEGNLALFDSGEGGAVPYSNYRVKMGSLDSLLLEMAQKYEYRVLQSKTQNYYVEKHLSLQKLQNNVNKALQKKERRLHNCFLLLSSDAAISYLGIEETDYNYGVRFLGEMTIIYLYFCRITLIQKLIEKGLILAGEERNEWCYNLGSLFGFFIYEQGSNDPFPYQRKAQPIISLQLDDLTENLQDDISWNWFDDLKFSEKTKIQPIEHFSCRTWGNDKWWVDTEGNIREGHPYD